MATRVCPECGSQYVASVRRCIDCDVMLVDEVGADGEAAATVATPLGAGDQIAYELDAWGNQLRMTLGGMLDLAHIPYVWEVGALVVDAAHEAAVDEFVAAVEGGEAEELDDDVPQVAFELDGVTADELAELDAELIAGHIPHAWQETGELLVPESSEEAVTTMIEAVLNPPDEALDDGLATHAALDTLYVAVDKLGKAPGDQKLVNRYVDAADGLDGLGVPYGLSGQEWDALLAQVAELRAVLEGTSDSVSAKPATVDADADDDVDDGDSIVEAAAHDAKTDGSVDAVAADDADDDSDGDSDGDADDDGDGESQGGEGDAEVVVDRIALATELVHDLRTRMLDLV